MAATRRNLLQVVIFHVERHPNVTWYEQCVEFNMFPTKLHQLTYRVLGMIMMYGLPLVVIIISYACILAEIFRRYKLSPDGTPLAHYTLRFVSLFLCFCVCFVINCFI
jgi:gonadotropin-releasing hormone receptor